MWLKCSAQKSSNQRKRRSSRLSRPLFFDNSGFSLRPTLLPTFALIRPRSIMHEGNWPRNIHSLANSTSSSCPQFPLDGNVKEKRLLKTSLRHQRTRYLEESKGCVFVIPISSGRYQQLNRSNLIYMSAFSSFMCFRILPEVSWNVHTLHTGAISRRFISRQSHICLFFETKFSVLRLDVATSSQGQSCHHCCRCDGV